MDTPQLLSAVYRETGVALDPSDPILTTASINRVLMDEAKADIRKMLEDAGAIASQAKQASGALSEEQFKELARRLGTRLEHSLKWEVRAIGWKPLAWAVLGGIVLAAMCFGAGTWWERSRSWNMQRWADAAYAECKKSVSIDKQGRRICTLTMNAD